jgi:predicted nuclease of predicted toxin-antitoxin system
LKILLDHNLDRRLKQYLTNYETATTQEKGWADVLNGELLSLAEQNSFEVLLTADSNIKNQQNITDRRISILVLRAFNNRLYTHAEMIGQIESALLSIKSGEIREIFHKDFTERLAD